MCIPVQGRSLAAGSHGHDAEGCRRTGVVPTAGTVLGQNPLGFFDPRNQDFSVFGPFFNVLGRANCT